MPDATPTVHQAEKRKKKDPWLIEMQQDLEDAIERHNTAAADLEEMQQENLKLDPKANHDHNSPEDDKEIPTLAQMEAEGHEHVHWRKVLRDIKRTTGRMEYEVTTLFHINLGLEAKKGRAGGGKKPKR